MQPYAAFFRDTVPLRQLKVILNQEGFEDVVIIHAAQALVFFTEHHGQETAVKIGHILSQELEEDNFVIVRSHVRLERLFQQNPLEHCANGLRFLLFEEYVSDLQKAKALEWAQQQTDFTLAFHPEGAYMCLTGESDRFSHRIKQLEETIDQSTLDLTAEKLQRVIQVVGDYERRLEASL